MDAVKENHLYDPLFPFALMDHILGKPEQNVNSHHFHDWYEIVYVHEGKGSFLIDKYLYPMKKGDLFIILGDVIHHPNSSAEFPYVCSVLLFHPMLIHNLEVGDGFSYLKPFKKSASARHQYTLDVSLQKDIEVIFSRMRKEANENVPGSRLALLLELHQLLLMINRLAVNQDMNEPMHKHSKSEIWMKEVLLYLDENLFESDLNLKELSEQALVSPEHFSRVFKKVTGLSLPAYIGLKKLYKAKGLLLQTDYSIAYISDTCGFKSVSYFHHRFRELMDCTPGEYRRQKG